MPGEMKKRNKKCILTLNRDRNSEKSYGHATSLVWMQQSLGVTEHPPAGQEHFLNI